MASKDLNDTIDKTRFGAKDEPELISLLFSRSFETLRMMLSHDGCFHDGCLFKDIKKAIIEEFNVGDNMARKHITSVIKAGLFSKEEDGRVYMNDKLIEWVRAYLLSIFPNIEGEHIAEMRFRNTRQFDAQTLENVSSLLPEKRKGVKLRVFRTKNSKKI